jgi:hypothetical protein
MSNQSGTKAKPPLGHSAQSQSESGYEVGYCRPPKKRRFKKGVSGNEAGRPRGSGILRRSLREILVEKMPVQRGGRMIRLPVYEVLVTNLVNLAMSGNTQLGLKLFQLVPYEEIEKQMSGRYKIPKGTDAGGALESYFRMLDD